MLPIDKNAVAEAHRPQWKTFWIWAVFVAALVGAEKLLLVAVESGSLLWIVPAVLLVAHLMHSQLLAFHEAAHGVLCPVRWINELIGTMLGQFHFNGLTLFRAVHQTHHAHLGTEKDEQLWPFVDPKKPRWMRWLAAVFELTLGIFFDAFLFWRAFFRKGSVIRQPKVRRRIWLEAALTASFWGLALVAVAWWNLWSWFMVVYVIPALICGDMHSIRKYIEHMGLTGRSVLSLTRSVVPITPLGKLTAFSMFNIGYHGVHHYYAGMPEASFARFKDLLEPKEPEDRPVFHSYRTAFIDMVPSLVDPRIGPQWKATDKFHPMPEVISPRQRHSDRVSVGGS